MPFSYASRVKRSVNAAVVVRNCMLAAGREAWKSVAGAVARSRPHQRPRLSSHWHVCDGVPIIAVQNESWFDEFTIPAGGLERMGAPPRV